MLKNFFYPFLQIKRITNKIIFQQDGVPAHFSMTVCSWLNDKFDGWWIGRGGPISQALRALDFTPLDFFACSHIKTNIYKTNIKDLNDLKIKIRQEIEAITKETLYNAFLKIKKKVKFLYFN